MLFDPNLGRDFAGAVDWLAAGSHAELCECSARFFERSIRYHPAFRPEFGWETHLLLGTLAAINRAGMLTSSMLPAVPLVEGFGQRAYLSGWLSVEALDRLQNQLLGTDLLVTVGIETQVPTTIENHRVTNIAGDPAMPTVTSRSVPRSWF